MLEEKIETEIMTLWTACNEPLDIIKSSPALLSLDGNSTDSRIFDRLLSNHQLNDNSKLGVFDFLEHGHCGDAPDPDKAYFQYAYAQAALTVRQHYVLNTVISVGWSLGGHVALDLVPVLATQMNMTRIHMEEAVITGTPPVPRLKIAGF